MKPLGFDPVDSHTGMIDVRVVAGDHAGKTGRVAHGGRHKAGVILDEDRQPYPYNAGSLGAESFIPWTDLEEVK